MCFRHETQKKNKDWAREEGKKMPWDVIIIFLSFLGILAWVTVNFLTGNKFSGLF